MSSESPRGESGSAAAAAAAEANRVTGEAPKLSLSADESEMASGLKISESEPSRPTVAAAAAAAGQQEPQQSSVPSSEPEKMTCVLVLGMAGSGKTTLVKRLTAHLYDQNRPPYLINLDPACSELSYPANIDIRDTVKYKEVMKRFNLGPNGGIITSLNLFATRFDQVMAILDKHSQRPEAGGGGGDAPEAAATAATAARPVEHVLMDTPGQIEVFTWSASGTIITEALASAHRTVVVYVVDLSRSGGNPVTFMSNMLYACSILYKTRLPFIVALNKCDAAPAATARQWMTDWEAFDGALEKETSYLSTLSRSLSLVLDTFYKDLRTVACSAVTGEGMDDLVGAIGQAAREYDTEYRPEYERIRREAEAARTERTRRELEDLQMGGSGRGREGDGEGGQADGDSGLITFGKRIPADEEEDLLEDLNDDDNDLPEFGD